MKFKSAMDYLLLSEVNFKRAESSYQRFKFGIISCFKPMRHFIINLVRAYYRFIGRTNMYAYTYGANNYTRYNFQNFFPITQISFEGREYNAPNRIHQYLTDQFGDTYMQIPNASDRYSHAVNVEFF